MIARRRGLSLRATLTLSYAGFLLLAGVALFVAGLLMLRFVPDGHLFTGPTGTWAPGRADLAEVFMKYAGWAFAALTVVGLGGGWLLAGWMLAPVGRIADVVRRVDAGTLQRRIALRGRRNELTELADAFDGMLDRIERAVEEEGRFAANASHELRTPHAVIRTIVEVARADPAGRDVDRVLERVAATNERAIATTEALLALARAGRAGLRFESVELPPLVAEVVAEARAAGARGGRGDGLTPTIRLEAGAAVAHANPALVRQLVANLVANALAYNLPEDGDVVLRTGATSAGEVTLQVANTGPVVAPDVAATLTEPFVRGGGRTRAGDPGVGLGLTIVAAIVRSHRGELEITAPASGGLDVRVVLPAA
ncbi:sensor histidine kinase [Microbacterium thalli]|uniref:histidine kinase n=1 Tax=Microbacterium thalli TaxID=3027921 RepID=A0ABT5SFU9_9MICO|nr:HAMP domain-containing sensor histidine kinase [Microbacterium thalli]MDD7929109.1 HAMP domain-containing sensor histidine kinase [Microbacterium thalli]MDD7961694.1 HAMP domain-containing sensor histidine kinase [Microbacterium thalli]